ncbi:MAG: 2-keto-4-pentenoate hydratase [Pseudomonadota bacterium]
MSRLEDISAAFIAARKDARALNAFPGTVPASLEEAYQVQSCSIRNWGEPVAGFKVGGIGAHWRETYPSPWLAGPVFPSVVFTGKDGEFVDVPVFAGGFAAYEPELIMRFENPSRMIAPIQTLDDAKSLVTTLHIGAEIASSPLADLNKLGPGSIISDFGNQAGMIVGPEIPLGWLDTLDELTVITEIDGEEIGRASPGLADKGPLGALLFLCQHLQSGAVSDIDADYLWLSSGAITGVHEAKIGSRCRMRYVGLGDICVEMMARSPLEQTQS